MSVRDNRNTKKAKVTIEKFMAKLREKFAGNIRQLNALKGAQLGSRYYYSCHPYQLTFWNYCRSKYTRITFIILRLANTMSGMPQD